MKTIDTLLTYFGSKRRVLTEIIPFIPPIKGRYIEPFVGSGSVILALQPQKAVVWDNNIYLMWFWENWKLIADKKRLFVEMELLFKMYYFSNSKEQCQVIKDKFNETEFNFKKALMWLITQELIVFPRLLNLNFDMDAIPILDCKMYSKDNLIIEHLKLNKIDKLVMYLTRIKNYCANNAVKVSLLTPDEITPDDFVFIDPPYGMKRDNFYYKKNNYNWKPTFEFCKKLNEKGIKFIHSNGEDIALHYQQNGFLIKLAKKTKSGLTNIENKDNIKPINDYYISNFLLKEKQQKFNFESKTELKTTEDIIKSIENNYILIKKGKKDDRD